MIQHPAILSLLVSSAIISMMLLFAGWKGVGIIRRWDIHNGSELQLQMERETYLISTILSYVVGFQLISLLLYIFTADCIHTLLVGAMCAAGTLKANAFGYPVLLLKVFTCISAGVWLIINHADSKGYDYPLVRRKYTALLVLIPFIVAETAMQFAYFGNLKAQVITSCCGSLFSSGTGTLSADLAALPRVPMEIALAASVVITCGCGIFFRTTGKGGYLFAGGGGATFLVGVASLVSFVSLYAYELPTHHCPFCILHREYRFIGYLLYAALLGGVISSLGVGVLMPTRKHSSLAKVAPGIQRNLAAVSMTLYLVFGLIVAWLVWNSSLRF